MANMKTIGALLGTLALGSMNIALADEAPKAEKAEKGKKGKGKGKKEGGEKSCSGADGKGCSGAK